VSTRRRGTRYEQAAREFLENLGLETLAVNYRYSRKEIDLVCRDGDELVFVEVKGGSADAFGGPIHKVDKRKQQALIEAARGYLAAHQLKYSSCRFDLVIVREDSARLTIEHLKNAFTL
jgi:putative endonuclease